VPEFTAFPKIPRLRRDCIITEKIDGTNAAVGITEDGTVYAQSRKRVIKPEADNFGFAKWVAENASALVDTLGPGLHFGEWWGLGIQRGYGLDHKRFSLFNTHRWADADLSSVEGLSCVPVLYDGMFNSDDVECALEFLHTHGSQAAPGFMRPEGIIVFHVAANSMFKVTLENDETPKALAA
jgi:hypothetical protein